MFSQALRVEDAKGVSSFFPAHPQCGLFLERAKQLKALNDLARQVDNTRARLDDARERRDTRAIGMYRSQLGRLTNQFTLQRGVL